MENYKKITPYLPVKIRDAFEKLPQITKSGTDEIRLRADGPVSIFAYGKNIFFDGYGKVCSSEKALYITAKELDECVFLLCGGSMYSYDETIRNGFIPLPFCRAGVCGETVCADGNIVRIGKITALNLRIHRFVKGYEKDIIALYRKEGIKSTLIYSPPAMGKTTLLRGIAYSLGNGVGIKHTKVGIADERREILLEGVDFGICDALSGCSKGKAIEMLTRVMSPQVIICDEISAYDVNDILNSHATGVSLICSCHAQEKKDLYSKPFIKKLTDEGVFGILVKVFGQNGLYGYECEVL